MKYLNSHLLPDEKFIMNMERHRISLLYAIAVAIFGSIVYGGGLIFIGKLPLTIFGYHPLKLFFYLGIFYICFMIWAIIAGLLGNKFGEVILTNRRILFKNGILSKEISEIWINKMQSIDLKQSLLGRIYNYGELNIKILDDPKPFRPTFLKAPEDFKKILLSLKETGLIPAGTERIVNINGLDAKTSTL